jgi:pimeloyl-ACP methyl ester carboxylesterase
MLRQRAGLLCADAHIPTLRPCPRQGKQNGGGSADRRRRGWYTESVATFCLLHGAWHEPSCWEPLSEKLEALGHRPLAPDLPLHDPAAGYERRVCPAVEGFDDSDDQVVVVAHSQSSALGPLVAAARPISLLVYLCPRMGSVEPPPGAPDPFRKGIPFPEARPDGTTAWEPETAIAALYPRLPLEAATALAQRLRPMAMPGEEYPLLELPDVPTVLIYATEDELFEPGFERFMARELLGVDPIELHTGHFPMVEDPDAVAKLLDRLARDLP